MASKRKAREERRRSALKAARRAEKRASTKTAAEAAEVAALAEAIEAGAPPRGSNPLALEAAAGAPGSYASARTFEELPLSRHTKAALRQAGYTQLTAIQRAALPHALAGRDILGAAKTGSGKTLCFLVPLVERLYRTSWARLDGLGALVLTPTRELALQIFAELVKVGRRHDLSAGLLIGGKAVAEEASRVNAMNILVATPGRLLQHMDETPGFDPVNLQLLVLDEADRILDLGFAATLDAILANLPARGRQTLLFSATQTKSVRDLARLSLDAPEYLAVHSEAAAPTPLKLRQAYMVVGLEHKMDVLWGFIKSHLAAKTIVFLSTCKQVRFVYEAFRKLRPGTPLRCLHGGMKQGKRMAVYEAFNASSSSSRPGSSGKAGAGGKAGASDKAAGGGGGVLFATDLAARGLDFPGVDWVLQADCPEDVAAYIHRVGRTARYTSSGRGLLLLLPSERDAMLAQLGEAKVPLQQLKHNPARVAPIGPALSALLSKSPELKGFAQSALVAYCRSVFLQPNKGVFDAAALPLDAYAQSLGLLAAPQLKFLRRVGKKVVAEVVLGGSQQAAAAAAAAGAAVEQEQQQAPPKRKRGEAGLVSQGAGSDSATPGEAAAAAAAGSKKCARRQQQAAAAGGEGSEASEDGGDFLTVKQHNVFEVQQASPAGLQQQPEQQQQQQQQLTVPAGSDAQAQALAAAAAAAADAAAAPRKRKRQRIKLGAVSGQRTVFDDAGRQLDPLELLAASGLGQGGEGSGGEGAGDDADGQGRGGLHVVADAPGARFARAAELMATRDRTDKRALAALRRQAKLEKKLKRKAAAQADAAAALAMLDGDGGSSADEPGSAPSSSSDGEDEQQRPAASQQRAAPDAAYLGMARKSSAKQPGPAAGSARAQPAAGSIAQQEALALALLTQQPW